VVQEVKSSPSPALVRAYQALTPLPQKGARELRLILTSLRSCITRRVKFKLEWFWLDSGASQAGSFVRRRNSRCYADSVTQRLDHTLDQSCPVPRLRLPKQAHGRVPWSCFSF